MKKAIVTTTINPPTKALLSFLEIAKQDGWHLIIIGDKKTPHLPYEVLASSPANRKHITYIHSDEQQRRWPELSKLIGWNCIQRRNFGFIEAYEKGAEIIATIDDDNIPYKHWGKRVLVNEGAEVVQYETNQPAFDPLAPCFEHVWHRGFPVQLLDGRQAKHGGMVTREVLVQADFWDGDPDVDAICRIALKPGLKFSQNQVPFCGDKISPFNSQNTFLSRKVFPTYFLFPHVGRMDDIWASYVTQFEFPDSVIYAKASVVQERNDHDLVKDLMAEMLGYRHNEEFVQSPENWSQFVPPESLEAYEVYKGCFE